MNKNKKIIISSIISYVLILILVIIQLIIFNIKIWILILTMLYGLIYFLNYFKELKKADKENVISLLVVVGVVVLILSARIKNGGWIETFLGPLFIVNIALFGYKHHMIDKKKEK